MKKKLLLCLPIIILGVLLIIIHALIFIPRKLPIVTEYFTIDRPYYMDGSIVVYGQYEILPYTNKSSWGSWGGINRGWGVSFNKHWPLIKTEWHKDYLDSNGTWHLGIK